MHPAECKTTNCDGASRKDRPVAVATDSTTNGSTDCGSSFSAAEPPRAWTLWSGSGAACELSGTPSNTGRFRENTADDLFVGVRKILRLLSSETL